MDGTKRSIAKSAATPSAFSCRPIHRQDRPHAKPRKTTSCGAPVSGRFRAVGVILVKKGDTGLDVGRIQQFLIESGCSVPQDECTGTFTYGEGTEAAVRAFQAAHLDPRGRPLTVDGIVGPATWWALLHPGIKTGYIVPGWRCRPDPAAPTDSVLKIASGEIGTHETPDGSNRGHRIDEYTAPDNIGDPWCACFVSWALAQGLPGGSPFGHLAAAHAILDWALAHDCVVAADELARPGDLFIISRGPAHGHTGFVCSLQDENGNFSTIEGNCSNAVRGLVRRRNEVSAIARPVKGT